MVKYVRIGKNPSEKLLGVTTDFFKKLCIHADNLRNKETQTLSAIALVSIFKRLNRRRTIMKAFTASHFVISVSCGCLKAEILIAKFTEYIKSLLA